MIEPEDIRRIKYDYEHAMNRKNQIKIMAELYAVSPERICAILGLPTKMAYAKRKKGGAPKRQYTDEQRWRFFRDLNAGTDLKIAADDNGINIGTARWWVSQRKKGLL